MTRRPDRDDLDVFDLFSPREVIDPRLQEALRDLAGAMWDTSSRAKRFDKEPDLAFLADAVQRVLDAAGYRVEAGEADRWAEYERDGRARARRAEAWLRCDALFRLDVQAAERGGWEHVEEIKTQLPLPTK